MVLDETDFVVACLRCLELDPQNTAALVRLMNVRVQLNDLEGAEQAILKVRDWTRGALAWAAAASA